MELLHLFLNEKFEKEKSEIPYEISFYFNEKDS
jgi:hypothetical protein